MILKDKAEQFQPFCVHWPWLSPVKVLACDANPPSSADKSKPAMAKSVDLPDPEGPKMATNSLGSTLNSSWLRTWVHLAAIGVGFSDIF